MDSSEIATSFAVGDPVQVSDAEGEYYGVIIDHVDDDTLCVQMMKKQRDRMYHITSDAYHVPRDAIAQHVDLGGDDGKAPRGFASLGFRMIDGTTFVREEDEVGDAEFPLGDAAFDPASDDEAYDSSDSIHDFIVPDDECEPFTLAECTSEFVQETHAAVRGFESWAPANSREDGVRRFIQGMETRAVVIDDNNRCARNGGAAPSYSNPQ